MNAVKPLFFAMLSAFAGGLHAATPNMKEGLWEVTAHVAGDAATKPTTLQHCISHKDLQSPGKIAPGGAGGACEIKDHRIQGDVVSWAMSCNGRTPMTGSGSITFGETTYTGQSRLSVKQGSRTADMTVHYSGKYIGPCKK